VVRPKENYVSFLGLPQSFSLGLRKIGCFEPPNLLKDWMSQSSFFVRSTNLLLWGCQTFLRKKGMTLSPAPLTELGYSCIT
jgi:hypothetical protein